MSTGNNLTCFSRWNGEEEVLGGRVAAHHHPGLDWVVPLEEVNQMTSLSHEALLVGAADRYRVGDMLMPHVMSRLVNFSKLRCAGLVTADLTGTGGHSVRNYGESILEMKGSRLKLVHYGSEDIAAGLVDEYRSAASGEEAERFESLSVISGEEELSGYVRRRSGQTGEFAYVLAPEGEFYGAGLSFHAIGLPEPWRLAEGSKARLLKVLRKAEFVGVRDENGANFLEGEGIAVERMPCGLSVLPQVCARQLRDCRDNEPLEAIRRRFPNGWIAVEISGVRPADFDRSVSALREVSESYDLGLVFYEASKPHVELRSERLSRWVDAFPEWQAAGFASENIWEVASLLLHSRLYCGSCLSSRIVCMSGGVARINFPNGSEAARSYCELWEHDSVPIEFDERENWADALGEALAVDLSALQQHAKWLHRRYLESLERFCQGTGMSARVVSGQGNAAHVFASEVVHHLHDEWLSNPESTRLFQRLNRRFRRKPGKAASLVGAAGMKRSG